MRLLKSSIGVLTFEALIFMQFIFFTLLWGHIQILKMWRVKLGNLQKERIAYDGLKK